MEDILEQAITNLQNEFASEVNRNELVNRVKEILPIDSTDEYKILNVEGTNTNFKANVKVNIKSEADVDLFVKKIRPEKQRDAENLKDEELVKAKREYSCCISI